MTGVVAAPLVGKARWRGGCRGRGSSERGATRARDGIGKLVPIGQARGMAQRKSVMVRGVEVGTGASLVYPHCRQSHLLGIGAKPPPNSSPVLEFCNQIVATFKLVRWGVQCFNRPVSIN